jgi:hypothetical protein
MAQAKALVENELASQTKTSNDVPEQVSGVPRQRHHLDQRFINRL